MGAHKIDIVADLLLNFETAEFATVVDRCRPLVDEFGVVKVEISRADPDGGRRGFTVSLSFGCPRFEGEGFEQALRRVILPVAFKYGINEEHFDLYGDPNKGGYGSLEFGEIEFEDYLVFGLIATSGGIRSLSPVYVPRHDFTSREDSDIISRIHLQLPIDNPNAALEFCGPLVTLAKVSVAEGLSLSATSGEESCELVLLSANPVAVGETLEAAMTRVRASLLSNLDLSDDEVEFSVSHPAGSSANIATVKPKTSDLNRPFQALYLRVGIDPFLPIPSEGNAKSPNNG